MERKKFLKSLLLGVVSAPVPIAACNKNDEVSLNDSGTDTVTNPGEGSNACTIAPSETEGPFPTKAPSSYVRSDITDGRTGYKLTAKITIGNSNKSCAGLEGAILDIWHCDAEGNYSEYGGGGMQSSNYESVHFLRGRQTTDANGLVTFTTIFPVGIMAEQLIFMSTFTTRVEIR